MATIGTFTKPGDRFTGAVRTLTLNVKARLRPPIRKTTKLPIIASLRVRPKSARLGKRLQAPGANTSRSSLTTRASGADLRVARRSRRRR